MTFPSRQIRHAVRIVAREFQTTAQPAAAEEGLEKVPRSPGNIAKYRYNIPPPGNTCTYRPRHIGRVATHAMGRYPLRLSLFGRRASFTATLCSFMYMACTGHVDAARDAHL